MTARARAGALLVASLLLGGCAAPRDRAAAERYRPRVRELTLTAVPLLVREDAKIYPFLRADFAPGGVLEGKEVYAFVPPSITAVEGDTLRLTIVNPEDDEHTLVLPGLAVVLPGQQTTRATYVAPRAGLYPMTCNLPTHAPLMAGQLVVLAPAAVAGAAADARGR